MPFKVCASSETAKQLIEEALIQPLLKVPPALHPMRNIPVHSMPCLIQAPFIRSYLKTPPCERGSI